MSPALHIMFLLYFLRVHSIDSIQALLQTKDGDKRKTHLGAVFMKYAARTDRSDSCTDTLIQTDRLTLAQIRKKFTLEYCEAISRYKLAQPFPPLSSFELPEIDGSAVDDICKIFAVTPDATPLLPTTEPAITTSAVTQRQVKTTAKKPTVTSPPRKPESKAPIRTQPDVGKPIPVSHSNHALNLLYYLLANSRGGVAGSRPIGVNGVMSSSDESAAVWKMEAFSSEDSSDES